MTLYEGPINLPPDLQKTIELAKQFPAGFNFLRVDLCDIGNKIYFSEFTPYPGGVDAKLKPDKYDVIFGEKWK